MAKVIFEFDTDGDGEMATLHKMLSANKRIADIASALYEFDQMCLRHRIKYEENSAEVGEALQDVRDRLYECFGEFDINFSDLIFGE